MKYSKDELLRMYHELVKSRIFILAMHDCVHSGLIRGSYHTQYGQEATGVGIATAMGTNDWVIPSHRSQSLVLAKFDLYQVACEMLSRRDGMAKGLAFDVHITDLEKEHTLPLSGTLSGSIAHGAGAALAMKLQKTGGAFIALQGDGGWSEGICYETANIASLLELPIVFVAEVNGWAMTVPQSREATNRHIAERVAPWGIEPHIIDLNEGCDVVKIREVMDDALEKARTGKPQIVEINNTRWEAHFLGQGNDYYTEEDKADVAYAMKHRDCVKIMEDYLISNQICDEAYLKSTKEKVQAEVDDAVSRAKQSPLVPSEEIYTREMIYASPETGGEF